MFSLETFERCNRISIMRFLSFLRDFFSIFCSNISVTSSRVGLEGKSRVKRFKSEKDLEVVYKSLEILDE